MRISRRTIKVAVPREATLVQQSLTASLYPYVSEEDNGLSRKTFLRLVRDRIMMDLDTGDY